MQALAKKSLFVLLLSGMLLCVLPAISAQESRVCMYKDVSSPEGQVFVASYVPSQEDCTDYCLEVKSVNTWAGECRLYAVGSIFSHTDEGTVVNPPTYDVLSLSTEENAGNICTDSDGADYYVRGSVNGLDASTGQYVVAEDNCEYVAVNEYICQGNYGMETEFVCPYGCQEGACISEFPLSIGTYVLDTTSLISIGEECHQFESGEQVCTATKSPEYRDTASNRVIFVHLTTITQGNKDVYENSIIEMATPETLEGLPVYRLEGHELFWLPRHEADIVLTQEGVVISESPDGSVSYGYPDTATGDNDVTRYFLERYLPAGAVCSANDPSCNPFDLGQYPKMFFVNGKFNGVIVVGDKAPAEHVVAATDIAASLQYLVDSYNPPNQNAHEWLVQKENNRLELSENLDPAQRTPNRETLADVMRGKPLIHTELPELSFYTGSNTLGDFSYKQMLYFDDESTGYVSVEKPSTTNDLSDYLVFRSGRQIARYVMDFTAPLKSDVDAMNNLEDLEDVELDIFGKTYRIVSASVLTSNTVGVIGITLMTGAARDTILEGETKSYTIGDHYYEVTLLYVDSDEVQFRVNGQTMQKLTEGDLDRLSDGTSIGVGNLLYQDYAGGIHSATFFLGAEQLRFGDFNILDSLSSHRLIANGASVNGASVIIEGTASGSVYTFSRITITMTADDDYYVPPYHKLSQNPDVDNPALLFTESWDIEYRGLAGDFDDELAISPSGQNQKQLDLEFFDSTGNVAEVPLAYLTTTGVLRLGDADDKLVLSENEPLTTDDYFIVSDSSQLRGERPTYALRYLSADALSDDNPAIRFQLLANGEINEKTLSLNPGSVVTGADGAAWTEIAQLKIGGGRYRVYARNTASDDFDIMIDLNGDGAAQTDPLFITTSSGNEYHIEHKGSHISFTLHTPDNDVDSNAADKIEHVQPTDAPFIILPQNGDLTLLPDPTFAHRWMYPDSQHDESVAVTSYGAVPFFYGNFQGSNALLVESSMSQIFPQVYITTKSAAPQQSNTIPIKLASEIADYSQTNIISVGNSCSNPITAAIKGGAVDCMEGLQPNTGRIGLYSTNGHPQIVVEGYSDTDVLEAGRVLSTYHEHYLSGHEHIVYTPTTSCYDSDYGADAFVQGYGYDGVNYYEQQPLQDACKDSRTLYEAACSGDYLTTHELWCENGCEGGVCKPYIRTRSLSSDKKVYNIGEPVTITAIVEANAQSPEDRENFGELAARFEYQLSSYEQSSLTLLPTGCSTQLEWNGYVKRCTYRAALESPQRGTYWINLRVSPRQEGSTTDEGYYGTQFAVVDKAQASPLILGLENWPEWSYELHFLQYTENQESGSTIYPPYQLPNYYFYYSNTHNGKYAHGNVYVFPSAEHAQEYLARFYSPANFGENAVLTREIINGNVANVLEYHYLYTDQYGRERTTYYRYFFWTRGKVLFVFNDPDESNEVMLQYLAAHPSDAPGSIGADSFRITLRQGWNLISSPVFEYNNGRYFNQFNHTCSFAQSVVWTLENGNYIKSKTLTSYASKGYWVKVQNDCSLTIKGEGSTSIENWRPPQLTPGWNMIGAPVQPVAVQSVEGYCNIVKGPYAYNPQTNAYVQASVLEPGKGYFVKVQENCQMYYYSPEEQPPYVNDGIPITGEGTA